MKEDYKLIAVADYDGDVEIHEFAGRYKGCWGQREGIYDYGNECICDYDGEVLIVANTQEELDERIQLYRDFIFCGE
jgi:hypothetical protein